MTMVRSDNSASAVQTFEIDGRSPVIDPQAWLAPTATVIGSVTLAAGSSIWYNAVVRGDDEQIRVGERSNVQDGAVIHADPGFPCTLGTDVTVGHNATLHGATVGNRSLIGLAAVVLNGAVIGDRCLVAAGALIPEGAHFDDDMLIVGAPAVAKRRLRPEETALLTENADEYVINANRHRASLIRA